MQFIHFHFYFNACENTDVSITCIIIGHLGTSYCLNFIEGLYEAILLMAYNDGLFWSVQYRGRLKKEMCC